MVRFKSGKAATIAALAIVVACHLSLLAARGTLESVSGDEGTFLSMISSLAEDGDLVFAQEDATRLETADSTARQAVILQHTPHGIYYSKPALFPLLAAPWYWLLGEPGIVLLNLFALAGALVLSWRFLRQRTSAPDGDIALWIVAFVGTGVLLAYTAWTMSDSLQASMALAGTALVVGGGGRPGAAGSVRGGVGFWTVLAGSLLLGGAAAMRFPNMLIALASPAALAVEGRKLRAALAAALLLCTFLLSLGVNQMVGGAVVPYKAVRATFNVESGYPVGPDAQERLDQFEVARATHSLGAVPKLRPVVSLYSAAYFFIGRHTGLLLYGFAALVFAWSALKGRNPVSWALLAGALAVAVFYVVWMPRNYFGGGTFLGNRYFLSAHAVLLLAPRRLPGRRSLWLTWGVGTVVFLSATVSSAMTRVSDGTSQMHAHAGIFRVLPYETTATNIDGRRDTYWHQEFIRFVDPYADVDRYGFRLSSSSPPANLVMANGREHGVIRFLVQANVPEVEIVYRDWAKTRRFRLKSSGPTTGGRIEILPSPALRLHPFWWFEDLSLVVRTFSLQVTAPDGAAAAVKLWSLGPLRMIPRFYRAEAQRIRVPSRAEPGTSRRIDVAVKNTGSRYWSTDHAIPIHLGYRLRRRTGPTSEELITGPFTKMPGKVASGAILDRKMRFDLPGEEGEYEVIVDLVAAEHNWFAEWTGRPLARRKVVVRKAPE